MCRGGFVSHESTFVLIDIPSLTTSSWKCLTILTEMFLYSFPNRAIERAASFRS